jgi:hypothetical protein
MLKYSQYNEAVFKSTLQYHSKLNPKLWVDNKLDPQVRARLLEIARVWQKFSNIENAHIVDIILTGGNANYNYTPLSDLDVHLVVDYAKMDCKGTLLMDYFMAKKSLWASTHSTIRVKGYPVELFAEDKTNKPKQGQGVYSLMKGNWIQEPLMLKLNFKKDELLAQKVEFFKQQIENAINGKQSDSVVEALKDKIRTMRGAAIQKGGEFSFENLVFKELRNRGLVDRLSNYLKSKQDKRLSLS